MEKNNEYKFEAKLLLARNLSYNVGEEAENNLVLEVIKWKKMTE